MWCGCTRRRRRQRARTVWGGTWRVLCTYLRGAWGRRHERGGHTKCRSYLSLARCLCMLYQQTADSRSDCHPHSHHTAHCSSLCQGSYVCHPLDCPHGVKTRCAFPQSWLEPATELQGRTRDASASIWRHQARRPSHGAHFRKSTLASTAPQAPHTTPRGSLKLPKCTKPIFTITKARADLAALAKPSATLAAPNTRPASSRQAEANIEGPPAPVAERVHVNGHVSVRARGGSSRGSRGLRGFRGSRLTWRATGGSALRPATHLARWHPLERWHQVFSIFPHSSASHNSRNAAVARRLLLTRSVEWYVGDVVRRGGEHQETPLYTPPPFFHESRRRSPQVRPSSFTSNARAWRCGGLGLVWCVADAVRRSAGGAGVGRARAAAARDQGPGGGAAGTPGRCGAVASSESGPRRDPRGLVPRARAGGPAGGVGRVQQGAARGHARVDREGVVEVREGSVRAQMVCPSRASHSWRRVPSVRG